MPSFRAFARVQSVFIVFISLALAGAGCARDKTTKGATKDSGSTTAAGSKTIGVTLLTREDEFYRELESGLRSAAAAHGYKILVTSGDRDLAKQQSQIDNFIVQHVDAIVVCPVDSRGIGPAIVRANTAKIPVFTADIAAQGGTVVSHVASDNIEGGRLAAEYIAKAIGDSGDVGVIGENDVQTTIDRQQGFTQALATHSKIKVVAQLDGSGVRDRSLRAADDLLQAHPKVRAIFAINDESALGTLAAAQARKAHPVIVGYDAAPEARRAILGSTPLRADVAQQPSLIGQKTIDAIASYFAGQTPEAKIAVPVTVLDSAALASASATPAQSKDSLKPATPR
ncbi:MAG TPA: substrate-binding domain-containing protein [Gemmatimonadaceae bacterium]|jgi:ribose transport system substrate-binding protein